MAHNVEELSSTIAEKQVEPNQGYGQAMRAFSPSLRRFFLSSALSATVAFGIIAVAQNLFLLRLDFDARFIGLMLGVGQMVWAAAALPAGMVSTRIGLRNGFLLGQGLFGLGLALIVLVEHQPEAWWRAWLMGSQSVVNLGVAFMSVSIPPYLMVVSGERDRRYAFAVFQAILSATAFFGSLLAGLLPGLFAGWLGLTLDQPDPYRLTLWVGVGLVSLSGLPLWGANPGRVAASSQPQAAADRPPIGPLTLFGLIAFLQTMSEGAVRAFFNIYLDTSLAVPPAQIGTIMGLAQLLPMAAALSTPLLIARWGTGYGLVAATLGLAVCLLPLAAIPQVWVAALAFMGVITMIAAAGTTRDLFGQELVTPGWRTTSQGAAIIGLALGWATAGVVGGYLIEKIGFGATFFAGAVAALLSATLLVSFLRRRRVAIPTEGIA